MTPNKDGVKGKEPCPQCRKDGKDTRGDNLIRYNDGHGKCYACGFYQIGGDRLAPLAQNDEIVKPKVVSLPEDSTHAIDYRALNWIHKYDIIREELIEHDIRWSPRYQWLLFPIRDPSGVLLAYQARTFGLDKSKWWSQGNLRDVLHVLGFKKHGMKSPVVIVEDIVSAIKVARVTRSMPLFGSQMSLQNLLRLKHVTGELIFWLDADKYKDSLGFARRAGIIGLTATVIYSEKDPKEYGDEYIRTAIENARVTEKLSATH